MEIDNVYIDIDDLYYDERVGRWVVATIDLDKDEVLETGEMTDFIDEQMDEAVKNARRAAAHDREVAVDDAVMHFVQGLLDAAAGLRPANDQALRVIQQMRAGQ